ncbi:MAG: hypothetical protein H7A33_07995 [Deltaproteobacteria bacterium]|nr:hypothetical protein [Deltaproteobacteria bacterium]
MNQKYSAETVAELLIHLAQNENFSSLKNIGAFTKKDVTAILNDLASDLKEQASKQPLTTRESVKQSDLTDNVHRVISKLSPQEESILFKSFKIS